MSHGPIFILGCERSGSTWLSNIIASHSGVSFLMEPFFSGAGILPHVPGRNAYLADAEAGLVKHVTDALADPDRLSYPLLYQPGKSTAWLALDRGIASASRAITRFTGLRAPRRVARFSHFNLHLTEMPVAELPLLRQPDRVTAIKDLRLNFKVGMLARCFPKAAYLVILRHPGAQIQSVLRMFGKGHLSELNGTLLAFIERLERVDRFDRYRPLFGSVRESGDMAHLLALWWLINYDVLIGDLQAAGLPHQVITHDRLSTRPEQTVAETLAFCGLPEDDQLNRYLAASSTQPGDTGKALDTRRDSAAYSAATIAAVPDSVRQAITEVLMSDAVLDGPELAIHPYLQRYFDLDSRTLRGTESG